jgi:hypothetical protein
MKRIEKARTDECLNPAAIPFSTRHVFRPAALVAVLTVMPFLVFTGCKQPDNDTSQPNGVESPDFKFLYKEYVDTFSEAPGEPDGKNNRSVVQAIREAGEDISSLTLNLWVGHENVVELSDNTDITSQGLTLYNKPIGKKNSPANITIEGNRAIVKMSITNGNNPSAPLITVGDGVKLTLRDITFMGLNNNKAPLIKVENGGTLILDNNVVITENVNSRNGGGVYVENGGTFEMREGKILNNTAANGGGVYIANSASFIMDGGEISGNMASENGGGVYMLGGTFDSSIVDISDNEATQNGGGVYVAGGTFNILVGTNIKNNKAGEDGGGVYVDSGIFDMNFGLISGNNVTLADGNGGGVYVGRSGKFEMRGGSSISGNSINLIDEIIYYGTPPNYPAPGEGKGPGVYVKDGGKFSKTGGTINGLINEAEEEWETKEVQNYYQRPVGSEDEDPDKRDFEEIDTTPGGAGRGYAVYDENRIINHTVDNSENVEIDP